MSGALDYLKSIFFNKEEKTEEIKYTAQQRAMIDLTVASMSELPKTSLYRELTFQTLFDLLETSAQKSGDTLIKRVELDQASPIRFITLYDSLKTNPLL